MLEKGLSILIKSFERKDALERLLQSVREFFPGCSVLIFDDSRRKPDLQLQGNESLHHCHTHDVGLSAGRNWLVENCTTTHFLLCDDDTVIVESLSSKQLINKLDRARYDILGGTVLGIEGWKGSFRRHEDRLVHLLNERNKNGYFDFIPNFFVADTKQIRGILWDESLKVCEHTEFFWRAKVNCEIDPNLKSANCRDRNHYYSGFRGRIKEFQKLEKSKIGVDAYDFVDPLNIKALAVVKATLADHPQGYMDEFNRRLGDNNSHSIDWVWEADVLKGDIPWERYNLVISNFTWIGPRESPPTMRCVYLNDDLHWNANNDTRDELIEVANASDLILSPYGQHANKIPEYIASHGKFRNLPYALPWWFEPRPWAGRKNKAAMSGGYHHEIYPLRTEITKECETGILNDEIEWLGNHPGWSIEAAPNSICREKYVSWLSGFMGGIATFGYGRYPNIPNIPYIVAKYLEMSALTCMFAEEFPNSDLEDLGFEPYEHYIPFNEDNWRDQISKWLAKPEEMRQVFLRSSALVSSRHYMHNRIQDFWRIVADAFGWETIANK